MKATSGRPCEVHSEAKADRRSPLRRVAASDDPLLTASASGQRSQRNQLDALAAGRSTRSNSQQRAATRCTRSTHSNAQHSQQRAALTALEATRSHTQQRAGCAPSWQSASASATVCSQSCRSAAHSGRPRWRRRWNHPGERLASGTARSHLDRDPRSAISSSCWWPSRSRLSCGGALQDRAAHRTSAVESRTRAAVLRVR